MHRVFRRLPFPAKLLLIGLVPFVFLIFTTIQIYTEKDQKVQLLNTFAERIYRSDRINVLLRHLQDERKYSFDHAMTGKWLGELANQRPRTDSIIIYLKQSDDPALKQFTSYTFLDDLQKVRRTVDAKADPNSVMHYYSTVIFRLNTLNSVPGGAETYLPSISKDLTSQKLLSEMITNLGIIRSNIYNVLYTRKYIVETLMGLIGVHDIYKTYEKELLVKASPEVAKAYQQTRDNAAFNSTNVYLDSLFKRFAFDNQFDADSWWKVSDVAVDELVKLQQQIWYRVNDGTQEALRQEKIIRNRTIIILALALLIVAGIVSYTIYRITLTLNNMKVAAQRISEGETNVPLTIESNDVIGDLAKSISKIDATNRMLAEAAESIGKGNFKVQVEPRGKKDVLGTAIKKMKSRLLDYRLSTEQSREELRQLASHLQDVREQERADMAREVHDVLGQQITCIKMDVAWLSHKMQKEDEEILEKIKSVNKLLDDTAITVRKMASELRPSILDDFGLTDALEWQGEEFQKRSGTKVVFSSSVPPELVIDPKTSVAFFRIYQESLTNVARHAEASKIVTSIDYSNAQLVMTISDNGKGFDEKQSARRKTLGLLGMKERTLMIGGQYEIKGMPGKGTTVIVMAPVGSAE
jgi:signal transduction histidine kinase